MKRHVLLRVLLSLLCTSFCFFSFAQNKTVTGVISDEKGTTLPGATVAIKGSTLATKTDANGNFSISVPASAKALVITFIGMEAQEVPIGRRTQFDIKMNSVASTLSDVVVVGYGTVRKRDLTGSVSSIKREDLIREVPTNFLQAMQGKAAGVTVTQNDGAPGAGLSLRIRGSNSFLGGTEPLYVIDGVPFNNSSSGSTPASIGGDEKQTQNALSFLNPSDIESIDILKDASATAIYGTRGANGVVLVTTRRGRTGRDRVELNGTLGVSEVSRTYSMLNAQQYAAYQNLAYTNANLYGGSNYTPDQFPYPAMVVNGPNGPYYKAGPDDFIGKSKDWQDEIFRKGIYQNYSVSVSGGNDVGNHSLSFNFLNQDGVIDHSGYNRFGLNLNLNRTIGKHFKMGTSTSVSYSTTEGVKTGTDKSDDANAGVVRSAITYPTTIDSIQSFGDAKSSGSQGYFITNPSIYVRDVLNKVSGLNIFSSNYMEYSFLSNFKFRQNIGFNYASNHRDQYYPTTVYEGFGVSGWGLKSDDVWSSVISESILTFAKDIGKHSLNAFVASTYEVTNSKWQRVEAQGFTSDLLQNENLNAGSVKMPVRGDRSRPVLASFLGRVNYSYDNRYLLTASFRRDGSSKFGGNKRWANFPSMAFAWKAINEQFLFGKVSWLSDLKLRLGYGQTGNQGIGSYAYLSKLAIYNYPFDGTLQTGYADDLYAGPANPDLGWETTTAYNAGIDVGFLNNRVNLHVDVYRKRTADLLQYLSTPLSSGFPQKLVNSGTVENKGLEVAVDGQIISRKDFDWSTNFNISFNKNKILSLGNDVTQQFAGTISTGDAPFIQVVGHPIGALYGYVEDGYYDNEAEIRNDPIYTGQTAAQVRKMLGEIKYRDLDGDPSALTATDRTFIGDVNPDYTFGFTNNFRYGNWDLSIFVNGVQGNDIINMNTRFMASPGDYKNITTDMLNGTWREGKDNSTATLPKVWRTFERTIKFTRRFIEDGSFVRVKNVTLGYNINAKIPGVQSLRVSIGVNNLKTWTDYSGYDPEMNSYGDNPALFGVDLGGYPNSRTYNFSVRCTF